MSNPLFYSREDLKRLGIPFSRATLYRKVRDGSFPKPVKLGENTNAWRRPDIHTWAEKLAVALNSEAK